MAYSEGKKYPGRNLPGRGLIDSKLMNEILYLPLNF